MIYPESQKCTFYTPFLAMTGLMGVLSCGWRQGSESQDAANGRLRSTPVAVTGAVLPVEEEPPFVDSVAVGMDTGGRFLCSFEPVMWSAPPGPRRAFRFTDAIAVAPKQSPPAPPHSLMQQRI